jgi:6,7-dimethyl-8-ribityllumazine synthase
MANTGNSKLLAGVDNMPNKESKIVIVKTEWNHAFTDELENGALRIFSEYEYFNVNTIAVPGAVEIPFAIQAIDGSYMQGDVYIAFACVIRGDTPHFEYVCQSITQGITILNTELDAPVIFGVLTVDTEAQALERIGGRHGHKGEEAAVTALKMLALKEGLIG